MDDPRDPTDPDRLKQLEERIEALKGSDESGPHAEEHYSQAQIAWRMVTELVAGLGIGFGIGYGLDSIFGTSPWLMVVFIFLGFAAGIQTMMRTAKEIQDYGGGDAPNDRSDHGGNRD